MEEVEEFYTLRNSIDFAVEKSNAWHISHGPLTIAAEMAYREVQDSMDLAEGHLDDYKSVMNRTFKEMDSEEKELRKEIEKEFGERIVRANKIENDFDDVKRKMRMEFQNRIEDLETNKSRLEKRIKDDEENIEGLTDQAHRSAKVMAVAREQIGKLTVKVKELTDEADRSKSCDPW